MPDQIIEKVDVTNPRNLPVRMDDLYPWDLQDSEEVPDQVIERFANGEYGEIFHGNYIYKTPTNPTETREKMREKLGIPADAEIKVGGTGWKRILNFSNRAYQLMDNDTELSQYLDSLESLEGEDFEYERLVPDWDYFTHTGGDVPPAVDEDGGDLRVNSWEIPNASIPGKDRRMGVYLEEDPEKREADYSIELVMWGGKMSDLIGGGRMLGDLATLADIHLGTPS